MLVNLPKSLVYITGKENVRGGEGGMDKGKESKEW